jgi:hypothetical protein
MIVSRQDFFKAQQRLQNIPFNQTEEWFEKCGFLEDNCRFFMDDLSNPNIGCWGSVYKRKFIGEHIIIDGECYMNSITSHHMRGFYKDIISCGFSIIEMSSTQFYDTKYEIGVRRAGFLRPMVTRLSPLTIAISTSDIRKTHKTWNRNVRLSTNANLTFKYVENPTNEDLEIFCNIFQELRTLKNLSYTLTANSMANFFSSNRYKLFFVYNEKGKPICGRIVYVFGKDSYDVHAANSIEARDFGAAYYIIDEILKYLESIGVKTFDYGRIPPSNNEMDEIYRAKSYSGGTPTLYNGQWVFYKSKALEYLLNGYFYFLRKTSRY